MNNENLIITSFEKRNHRSRDAARHVSTNLIKPHPSPPPLVRGFPLWGD